MNQVTVVNKNEFEIAQMIGGQYCIVRKNDTLNANPIWGGDPADEDSYDLSLAEYIFKQWNGDLDEYGKIIL